MTYIKFITGLMIAAVLSVPSAMQHEATQVENEPVENIAEKMAMPQWFEYDGPDFGDPNYNPNLAANYKPYTGPTEPDCEIGDQVCAVKLRPDSGNNHPLQAELTAISGLISAGDPVEDLLLFVIYQ